MKKSALAAAALAAAYYCLTAIKYRRFDIAWAYLRGTLAGIFGVWRRR